MPAFARWPLWSSGFRPFFLGAAVYGPFLLALWFAMRAGGRPAPANLAPGQLHAHEMLFGFAAALVCGVLLTALPSWSGAREMRGRPLAALAGLWLAGRIAFLGREALSPAVAMVLDCALFPALLALLSLGIAQARRRLFWWTVLPLVALAGANLAFHLALGRADAEGAAWALRLGVHALAFLFTLYGGLFVPAFTRRWLQARGERSAAILMPLEVATAAAMLAFAGADLAGAPGAAVAVTAAAAALVHAVRFARWRGWRTASEPLLWCVHLGYAWLVAALALRAVSEWVPAVPRDAWIHAFTLGAYGLLKIGLMTRVVLRHTGRPLVVSPAMKAAFAMMLGAALARLAWSVHGLGEWALALAAVLWAAAFLVYLAKHGAMLVSPSLPRP